MKKWDCTLCEAKTRALTSFAVTPLFSLTSANCWFSHDAAQMSFYHFIFHS